MEALDVEVVAICLATLVGVIARGLRRKKRDHETPVAVLVKRRRALVAQLRGLVGGRVDASRLVRPDAQRLRASPIKLDDLEAAVLRVASKAHDTGSAMHPRIQFMGLINKATS